MKHYIKFQVTETRVVELKRVPTNEEIELINHNTEGSMYDTPSDLIDWGTEDVCDADHNWVKLFINGHEIIQ
jgi:hypothetical protein